MRMPNSGLDASAAEVGARVRSVGMGRPEREAVARRRGGGGKRGDGKSGG